MGGEGRPAHREWLLSCSAEDLPLGHAGLGTSYLWHLSLRLQAGLSVLHMGCLCQVLPVPGACPSLSAVQALRVQMPPWYLL